MEAHGERLDQCTASQGNIVWESMAHGSRVVCALHEGTVKMGEDLRAAAELHRGADVVAALLAQGALTAGQADFESDAVADFQGCHVGPDGRDGAGGFVAQAHGLAHDEVAIPAVAVVVQVGAAEARCLDGDLDIAAGGSGYGAFLLEGS